MLVCVLVSRISTGATGVFVQERVGQHGKKINVKKIRTMRSIDGMSSTVTVVGDARITRIGSWMRRWKLDELPQLWNVFTGDMSFVGPRPDVPGYADKLTGHERNILKLKPGITGPATIKYRDEEVILSNVADVIAFNDEKIFPDKVRINLEYLENWSLKSDIKFILITLGLLEIPVELQHSNSTE